MSEAEGTDVPLGRPTKSSSEILSELFGSFNTSFDDEAPNTINSDSDSTPSPSKKSRKKKKHKEKDKDKTERKKSKKLNKSSSPEGEVESSKSSSKRKAGVDKDSTEAELGRKKSKKSSKSKESVDVKPDKKPEPELEEGEITEKAEKRAERKQHLRKRDEIADEPEEEPTSSKRSHRDSSRAHSSKESSKDARRSSSSHSKQDKERSTRDRSRDTSSRRREESSRRSRSRSASPVLRSAPPRRDYSSGYKALNWEKARDSGLSDKNYYSSNVVRRNSDYNYEAEKKYSGSRGGFGYSGSSSRYEDDYYDYRRSSRSSHRSSRRSRSRSRHRSRSRSKTRARSTLRRLHPDDIIDKAKLLEIARENASKLMRRGVLPSDIFSRDQIRAITAGGKSVEELTEYCKKIAKRDAMGDAFDRNNSSDDDERLIHHPYVVVDRPMPSITMNIRNAIPLPVRSSHELAIENAKLKVQFPVSSGTQHRYKEIEWKPVEKDGEKKEEDNSKALVSLKAPKVGTVAPMPQETDEATSVSTSSAPLAITDGSESSPTTSFGIMYDDPKPVSQVDIGSVISKRLRAMRELQQDPDSAVAKEKLESATQEMREWAEAKALEPKFLTPAEIINGPQAWARKDQLKTASAVKSPMGMHLLQRMGWKPGEGLGKFNEGSTEPLLLDVKMDKKGLTGTADKKAGPSMPTVFDLSGKHPVSSLMELCAKRRWGTPNFELCFEHGPSHKPQFVYKVTVNGVEYQPCVATTNKKEAKTNAAAFCLQSLGLLPTPKVEVPRPAPSHLLQTVATTSTTTPSMRSHQTPAPITKPPEFLKPAIPPAPRPSPAPRLQFSHSNRGYNNHSGAAMASVRPIMSSNYYGPHPPIPPLMQEEPIPDAPIVQVPVPPPSALGYSGLTTF